MPTLSSELESLAGQPDAIDPARVRARLQQRRRHRRAILTGVFCCLLFVVLGTAIGLTRRENGDGVVEVATESPFVNESYEGSTTSTSNETGPASTSSPVEPDPGSSASSTIQSTTSTAATTPPASVTLAGALPDGRDWQVVSDQRGLCVTIGGVDVGCSAIPNPSSKPLTAAAEAGPYPEDEAAQLMYGFLEPGASALRLGFSDGRVTDEGIAIDPTSGLWVAVLVPGDNADTVIYLSAAGDTLAVRGPYDL